MSLRDVSTLAALAFAAFSAALHGSFGAPMDFLILETTLGVVFIAAGAVAWRRRPELRTGPLLTLSGVLWFAGGYTPMPEPLLSAIGFALIGLYDLPLAYLLLTFPAERLVGVRALGVAALGLGLLGRGAGRLLLAPHPFTPFGSWSGFQSVESPTSWLIAAAALFVAMTAVVRWLHGRAFLRRVGWPLFAAGVLAMAMAAFDATEYALDTVLFAVEEEPLATITGWAPFIARALIPLGFLVSTLRLRHHRLAVAEVALQTGGTSVAELERALSSALADPGLAVLRWSDAANAYFDREGQPVALPGPGDPSRAVTYIDDDGHPYAAVVHDALLTEERSILGSLQGAARQALQGEDLRAVIGRRAGSAQLPSGDVTLLFSDIEDSTGHLQRMGLRYAEALEEHRSIIRDAIREHGGREVESVGDEFFAAFESPAAVARAAVAIQRGLQRHPWPDGRAIRVRMGLHRGTVTLTPNGYVGLDVHRAARIMSAANGGQILASEEVAAAADSDAASEIRVRRLGPHRLRGLDEPVAVALLDVPDAPAPSVPIRAEPAGAGVPA